MADGMGFRHEHSAHAGSEDRIKFQTHPGIQDAYRRYEQRKAEGKTIPRSPRGQRSARETLIDQWHERRRKGWDPETSACP